LIYARQSYHQSFIGTAEFPEKRRKKRKAAFVGQDI
jgi:hypothetical protein